eukprot:Trichotokara_eunicae@DN5228_c0_g1_i3.p1
MEKESDMVELNVRGTRIATSFKTLAKTEGLLLIGMIEGQKLPEGPNSHLAFKQGFRATSFNWRKGFAEYFFDVDPTTFMTILNYYKRGFVYINSYEELGNIRADAQLLDLKGLHAQCGKVDHFPHVLWRP